MWFSSRTPWKSALDQEDVVQYDPTPNGKGSDNVTRAAQVLSRAQGGHIVLSLPLRRRAEVIGVVTLEFLPTQNITPQVAHGLGVAADLLAPQLYDRFQNDRYLAVKVGLSTKEVAKATIGPKHMLAKLIAVAVAALVAVCILYRPMYHVTASFTLAPENRYSLSAPWEGVLGKLAIVNKDGNLLDPDDHSELREGEHYLKPGDKVKKGQVLLKMKTTDLELRRNQALAEEARYRTEAQNYRADAARGAEGASSKAQIAEDQGNEAKAQADLLTAQIEQGILVAPRDAVLLKGDLEDKQGSPVKQGDVLLEVGQPQSLKPELAVNERDIQDLKVGAKARFATTSLPDDKFDMTIERIVPQGDAKEGNNVFKVYGRIEPLDPKAKDYAYKRDLSKNWLPGMAGEARVDVSPRPLWWIASHRLVDFLKLKLWF